MYQKSAKREYTISPPPQCSYFSQIFLLNLLCFAFLFCLLYYRHDISVILRGFPRGQSLFFYPFGVKINVYGATIRPNFLVLSFFIVLFYRFFLFLSSYSSLHISLLILLFLYIYIIWAWQWAQKTGACMARARTRGQNQLENPRKLKEKPQKIGLDWKRLLPLSRKIQARTHPLSCFFAAEVPWFNQGAFWVVKPLKRVF